MLYFLLLMILISILSQNRNFKEILQKLRKMDRLLSSIGVVHSIEFQTMIDGQLRKVTHMFLKISQKLPVSVKFKDKLGNEAKVDGKPEWSVTDPSLCSLEVAEDGMSAFVLPLGGVGSLQVQVKADADLGEGVKQILGSLDLELVSGEAVSVDLLPGEPVDLA